MAPHPLARTAAVLAWQARTYRRAWRATLMVSFLTPILFLLSIGGLVGKLVDEGSARLGGLSYLEFVTPGLLAATAMQVAVNEGTYPIIAGTKWLRTYHAVVTTPVGVPELVAGVFLWIAVRVAVAVTAFAVVAAAAGAFTSPLAALAPLAALLCGLAFAAPLAALAPTLEDESGLATLRRFVILPLFLFSGTFFPVDQLPDWVEPVAWATPLWHGVSLCRDLATGSVGAFSTAGHVAYLLVLAVAGAVLFVRVQSRKLLE
jgi:lipooligosaccharide transport system permease protein